MNIQFAEGYKNEEKGEKERGFCAVGAGAREKESEPGGPNSEDGVGAGAREKIDAVRNMSMKRRRD